MQFEFRLEFTGDLVQARIAGHGYLVVFAGDAETLICIGARCRAKYKKILQLGTLLVLASSLQHHLAQFPFILAVLGHLHLRVCNLSGGSRWYVCADAMPLLIPDAAPGVFDH